MTPTRHLPQALPLATVLAASARAATRTHGLTLLDIRPQALAATSHVPGSAQLPVAGTAPLEGELPSHLLSEPGRALCVLALKTSIAAAAAQQLCERGWAADYAAEFPSSALQSGPSRGALWAPCAKLVQALQLLPAGGHAIDFGCGSGRDLVYLAQCGWQALGIDRLPDALEMAQQRARLHGVAIACECADARELEPGERQFGLALCVRYTELAVLQRAQDWVAPGGALLFHGYGADPARKAPRTMRARNRLSVEVAHELLPPAHWSWIWPPQIEWVRDECWQLFLAQRVGP